MADQKSILTVWCKYNLTIRHLGAGTTTLMLDEAGSGLRGKISLPSGGPPAEVAKAQRRLHFPPHIIVEGDTMFPSAEPSCPQFLQFIKHTGDRIRPTGGH